MKNKPKIVLYDINQIAEILKVSERTARYWIKDKAQSSLPVHIIGKKIQVEEQSLLYHLRKGQKKQ
jgi:hypothetical protein